MTTQTDTAPLSAEELAKLARSRSYTGALDDLPRKPEHWTNELVLRLAADALDALSARVKEMEALNSSVVANGVDNIAGAALDERDEEIERLTKRVESLENSRSRAIADHVAAEARANRAEGRATQAEAERDDLRIENEAMAATDRVNQEVIDRIADAIGIPHDQELVAVSFTRWHEALVAERDEARADLVRAKDAADRAADEMTDRWHADQAALAEARARETGLREALEKARPLIEVIADEASWVELRPDGPGHPFHWFIDGSAPLGTDTAAEALSAIDAALSPAQPAQDPCRDMFGAAIGDAVSRHLEGADPLDMPLPCDVNLPNMRFGKGVSLRTLVDAAARWKVIAAKVPLAEMEPALEEARSAGLLTTETEGSNG